MINNSNSAEFLKKSIPLMEKAKIPGYYLDDYETEKLSPQPHRAVSFGLLKTKDEENLSTL